MTLARRILSMLALSLFASAALAQAWPTKPIRMVIPFPPGGFSDVFGRILGEKFGTAFGQSVVVENRPGAGGHIGADIVAKSPETATRW